MAATRTLSPLLQLYNQVFPATQRRRKGYARLGSYIRRGGSVFPLVEKGVDGLVRDFGISRVDAQHFLRRANALAFYVRRQFIEQTLTGTKTPQRKPPSGPLAMVEGPSYERLFPTDFDGMCPPDAPESVASPVAYLIELLIWIIHRIEPYGDKDNEYPDERMMPLHERRTDIESSLIDFNSVHRSVSSVDIIIPVLETFIKAHGEGVDDVDEAMSQARYPNGLPYYRAWTTIDFVARHHGLSVGAVVRKVDQFFPFFLPPYGWGSHAGLALLHASRLGPYQRNLLTEPPLPVGDDEAVEHFYEWNFGTYGLEWQNINQVPFFCERTKLEALALEALLSIRGFAPVRSANVPPKKDEPLNPMGAQSGSVYLNAGTCPSVGIDFSDDEKEGGFLHRLTEWSHSRVDRMNRKLRLDQWLELPSDQVDALLVAAINAESRAQPLEHEYWISNNTLQAIGLFQELRESCGCSVEDFVAFIDQLLIFGRGKTPSLFDQVFNAQAFSSGSLKLDDGEFPVFPVPGEEGVTVSQICRGLGINLHTYRYLAEAIAQALGRGQTLKRDVVTLSSFYRMVKLPLLLGITPVEAIVMLLTLGGDSWLKALAGIPRIQSNKQPGKPDVLSVIHAMQACVQWCTEHTLPVAWMLQQVTPITESAGSSEERQLFEHVQSLLTAALFSNAALLMAGVPPLAGGADWLDLLAALVDHDGVVLTLSETIELDYPAYARERLDLAVRAGIGEGDAASRAPIVEKMLEVLLLARAGQVSVVRECLAVYAGLRPELVMLVLTWAQGTVYQVLRQAFERPTEDDEVSFYRRRAEDDGGGLLKLLAEVRRRSAVVVKLDVSAELLEDYLAYGYHGWMNLEDKHEFSLSTLYYLSVLVEAFAMGSQPPAQLLDYLRKVNALPDPLTGDALHLAQETAAIQLAIFFNWSIQEVRECAQRVDTRQELIKNLEQLGLLIRVRKLAASTGMEAKTIFLMGSLPRTIDRSAYSLVAEHALLSLSTTPASFIPLDGEALEHMVRTTCEVDRTELVANKLGEKAIFTVTVTGRAGVALSGVNVYWETKLGSITANPTDVNGVATAHFTPGSVMGTATPRFWLDLYPKQQAPSVVIGADKTTLFFPGPLISEEPDGAVAKGLEIELYAVLQDTYGNRGINERVQWTWSSKRLSRRKSSILPILDIRPSEASTNQEGLTRVFASSPTGGTFEIKVTSLSSTKNALFEPITFAGDALPR